MTDDGGRRGGGDDGETPRTRTTLRVVDSTSTPSPSGSPYRRASLDPAPTDRTPQATHDDAGSASSSSAPGLAGRRRGAARPPGARAGGAHGSSRIPVYPRVPTGPLRATSTPAGRRSDGHAHGPTRQEPAEAPSEQAGPLADPPTEQDPDDAAAATVALTTPTGDAGATERLRARSEQFGGDDAVLAAARERATEHGIVPIGPGACAALTFLASATRARSVVEIGSGAGLGTVSLLRGMPREGLLTSIDCEAPHQSLARQAYLEAGFPAGRVRMITGRALDVLPRLSDAGYDLVLVDALTVEYPRYLEEAVRLLRPGGVVALDNVLWTGRVSDPVRREAISSALRETVRAVRADERLAPLLLPVSDGLLCASLLS